MKKFILRHFIAGCLLALLLLIQACAVNPVTGKKELSWMSEAWELQTGERYYGFQQQAGNLEPRRWREQGAAIYENAK